MTADDIGRAGAAWHVDRDELLARVDLEALLDALVGDADQRGRWHCPERDHPDEHPSVSVRVSADGVQRWRCWSGGHGGTAIDAAVAARGLDTGEAIRWLAASYANLQPLPRRDPPPLAPVGHPDPAVATYAAAGSDAAVDQGRRTATGVARRPWPAARGAARQPCRRRSRTSLPATPQGSAGRLAGRRLPVAVTDRRPHLPAGPLPGAAGEPVQVRQSVGQAGRQPAAGLDPTRRAATDGVLVVCEGTADALIAAQAGIAAVGVLGAAYPDRRVADGIVAGCRQHPGLDSAEVVVCFDDDPAGATGSARLVELLAERGISASERRPPDGLDLTTWSAVDPRWTDTLPTARRHSPRPPQSSRRWPASAGRGGAEHLHRRDRLTVGSTDLL